MRNTNYLILITRLKTKSLIKQLVITYVIQWVVVVFGINCASYAGWKLVIKQGTAEHYY